jgi:hypothetical protein
MPLWSSGQSSWLHIQRPGFDSRRYQIFWEVVGLELSLVSTIEELLGRKSSGSGLEIREYGSRDPSRWPHGTLDTQKLALTLPTSSGLSVGMVRSRTKVTEYRAGSFYLCPQQVQGSPIMRPATGYPSHRLLRLEGLQHGDYLPDTNKPPILNLHILL